MSDADHRQAHVRAWLEALEAPSRELTKWEEDFLDSLREQLERGRTLTVRQLDTLETIYAEKTP